MDLDTKIKEVLVAIKTNNFNEDSTLPNESREELKRVVLICEDDEFIKHRSSKKKLVIGYKGGFFLSRTAYVTRAGEQFLKGLDRSAPQSSTVFNIEKVESSALGNYNTVNNYSETPLEDLAEFIKNLEGDFKSKAKN